MSEELLQQAQQLHRESRFDEALALYRRLVAEDEGNAAAWRLKAIAEHQARRLPEAGASIRAAIALDESQPESHMVLAHLSEDARDYEAAVEAFRRATELRPEWVAAWVGLGTRLLDDGYPMKALPAFQKALDLAPASVRTWNNLGMAQMSLERFSEAERAFNHAVSLDPGYGIPHLNLAKLCELRGDSDQALACARRAVALDPRLSEAHMLIGDILRRGRDVRGAEQAYRTAAALAPTDARPANALADLFWELGHVEVARSVYKEIATRQPANFKSAAGARLLLPAVYDSLAHLEETRRRYAGGLEELHALADDFRWKNQGELLSQLRWTNFYLAYQGREDLGLQRRYGELVGRILEANAPAWLEAPRGRPGPRDRIRVGFFSYFFFNCTAGRYFASWIRDLDPKRFEIFVYYTNPWIADDTREIAAAAHTFRHLPGRPVNVMAEHVRADELDVLVYPELGMNAETFALASLRLAPVQVAGWGHPTTTGLPTVDWFLSSEAMEPEGAQAHYAERLALLPGLGTRYAVPTGEEAGGREDFGLPEDAHLYLLPQSIFKIHPDNDELVAEVLARDPKGRIVMFAANHDLLTDRFVKRLAPPLRARGMQVADRVIFLPYMTHGAYLRLNRLCDVMLDTLHWSGGNTSLDALSVGLPVVTLPGALMRGRQSRGMLEILGVPELVAADREGYVRTAVALAQDRGARESIAERLAQGRGALFDRTEPVRAFERFLEEVARP